MWKKLASSIHHSHAVITNKSGTSFGHVIPHGYANLLKNHLNYLLVSLGNVSDYTLVFL